MSSGEEDERLPRSQDDHPAQVEWAKHRVYLICLSCCLSAPESGILCNPIGWGKKKKSFPQRSESDNCL